MTDPTSTAADRRWLAATWPFVRQHLPPPPARVLELGCGPLGGFVPALLGDGYESAGIDPEAPDGPAYRRIEFERYAVAAPVDAVVASTSLHHVADIDVVVDGIARVLAPRGRLVVLEWAREEFDEATARWCFDRLTDDEPGWLHRHRVEWAASEKPWHDYLRGWAEPENLHSGEEIVRGLAARFDTLLLAHGPYFFPDLDGVTATEEQAAIDAGHIRANGIRYVGRLTT